MSELVGRSLGPYRVLEEIGRGGMAAVYKAWQPSLQRYVAVKVLPPYYAHDAEFLTRFQREAWAAARLNHPNVVLIYDTGEAEGQHYIAMEYLEGGSLQDRLGAGSLGPHEARPIVDQVAGALDYAHVRGVVHRDVKPANILFTADGRAKVTDFGIARAADGTRLTRTGVIMGTPEYMAPEQAEGRPVDHRADLYALGAVLYQMLTGQAPFRSTTPHATLHAVIYESPPSPRQINPRIPLAVENVVLKALAKQPEERYQSGADLAAALRAALAGTGTAFGATPRRRSPLVWFLAAALVTLLLLAGLLVLQSGPKPGTETPGPTAPGLGTAGGPVRTVVVTSTPLPLASSPAIPSATLSAVATNTRPPGTGTPLPATEAPALETETPAPSTATPVPPTNTPVQPTSTSVPPTAAPPPTKTQDAHFGRLAFSSNRDGNPEIYVLDLAGGGLTRLTNNDAVDWLPDWSPDGARIAFTSSRRGGYDLWAMDGGGGGQTALVTTDAWDDYPRWAPDGQRLALSTTARTQGIDNSEIFLRRTDGQLVQLTHTTAEDQWPDWSPGGQIIYTEGSKGGSNWDIYVMKADGSSRQIWLDGPTPDVQPTWSPDGQWVAFVRIGRDTNGNGVLDEEDAGDIWVGGANGGGLRQLTSGVWAVTPAWSPDSRWVAYAQLRDSNGNGVKDNQDAADIWAAPIVGGADVPLVQGPHRDGDPSWTR